MTVLTARPASLRAQPRRLRGMMPRLRAIMGAMLKLDDGRIVMAVEDGSWCPTCGLVHGKTAAAPE